MISLAVLSLLVWCWLWTMHGAFWRSGPELPAATPPRAPPVVVVVPARDEAPLIERTIRSLLAQSYPGPFRIILVDDRSADGTGAIARAIGDPRLNVISGAARPAGWAGKLWAEHQGVAASGAPEYILLTDADIEHEPAHLASLVAKADRADLDMVSEMVTLSCRGWAEKSLIPAFVFFFQLLYPFAWVNDPLRRTAAAAGGTILLRNRALARIGGLEAVRGALIDDVALAGAVKRGGRIYLGHSMLARSVRPYAGVKEIWRMIARSAYAQLHFSRVLLVGTVLGMLLVWIVPPALACFAHGLPRAIGLITWALMAAAYVPTLARYRRSFLWAPALPVIALFYTAATVGSALNHHRGQGVVWKGRAYAGGAP
jgi:hopene-associated glycosyltransferase HpnB